MVHLYSNNFEANTDFGKIKNLAVLYINDSMYIVPRVATLRINLHLHWLNMNYNSYQYSQHNKINKIKYKAIIRISNNNTLHPTMFIDLHYIKEINVILISLITNDLHTTK